MSLDGAAPFAGRTILVLGGSSGTGLEIVRAAAALGSRVAIGTRSAARYEEARASLPGAEAIPFVADLADSAAVEAAVAGFTAPPGIALSDVVVASAGGMESFLRPVLAELLRLQRRTRTGGHESDLEAIRERVARGVAQSLPAARAVNFDGPVLALRLLLPHLEERARIVFLSSLWSSVYTGDGSVPGFYAATAQTKQAFERHVEALTPELNARGIFTAILSGHLILDTAIGKAISRCIVPLLPEGEREALASQFIAKQDVVDAMLTLLHEDPRSWAAQPEWRFVFGPGGQVTRELPKDSALFRVRFPI